MGLSFCGAAHYRLFSAYCFLPGALFGVFYSVYLIRRHGGAPGKLTAGLRLRKVDGTEVEYREALLRYLPESISNVPSSIALIVVTAAMSDAD